MSAKPTSHPLGKKEPTIDIEGITYTLSDLSGDVQNLIGIYQKWEKELDDARIEVFKLEGAIKAIGYEIQSKIKKMEINTGQ